MVEQWFQNKPSLLCSLLLFYSNLYKDYLHFAGEKGKMTETLFFPNEFDSEFPSL